MKSTPPSIARLKLAVKLCCSSTNSNSNKTTGVLFCFALLRDYASTLHARMKTFSFALLFAFACASAEKRNLRSLVDVSVYGSKGDSGDICAISCGSGTVQIGNQCVVGASCQALWKDGEEPHYDPKHPCQCNSLCSVYRNCCLDYMLPENSCVSKGCPAHYKQEWQCQCNDLCVQFGNCCKDAHKCAVPTKGTLSPTTTPRNRPPTIPRTRQPSRLPTFRQLHRSSGGNC